MTQQLTTDPLKCTHQLRSQSRHSFLKRILLHKATRPSTPSLRPSATAFQEATSKNSLTTLLKRLLAKEAFHTIFSSPDWTRLLDRSAPTPSTESMLDALEQLVPLDSPAWRKVDYLVEQLVLEGHNELATDLLEVSVECGLAKDASFANYFRVSTRLKHFDEVAETAMKWILSNQKCFQGHAANCLLYCAHISRRPDTSLELLKLMHENGTRLLDDYPYSITIHTCNEARNWNQSLEIFQLFKTSGKQASPVLIRNLLHTFQATGRKDLLAAAIQQIKERSVDLTMSLFKALMETSRELSDVKSAMTVVRIAQERRMDIDIWALNSILVIFKDNASFPSLESCFKLIRQMQMKPDAFTFGLLLGAASRTSQSVQIIDQIIQEIQNWEVPFNTIILHSALMAYRKAVKDPAEVRLARARELLAKHDCSDAACYGTVLVLCMQTNDLHLAFEMLKEMEGKQYRPTTTVLKDFGAKCEKQGLTDYSTYLKKQLEINNSNPVQSQ